jgi:hypothetical protein
MTALFGEPLMDDIPPRDCPTTSCTRPDAEAKVIYRDSFGRVMMSVSLKITCAGCAQLAGKLLNIYQRPC